MAVARPKSAAMPMICASRPGDDTRRKRRVRQPPQGPRLGALRAQWPGAAHLRGAPARRRTDHAPGACRRVRRLARARAPDRRACLREGAEVGEEPRRRDGNFNGSAGALASNPLQWWKNCRWTCRHEYVLRQPDDAKGVPLVDQRTEICVVRETEMIADPKRKPRRDEGDSDKRRRQEEALDEALENTFPASDPVSVEQPMTSGRACRS